MQEQESQTVKPNCYDCGYREDIPGDKHSSCHHPTIAKMTTWPLGELMGLLGKRIGPVTGLFVILNIKGNPYGIRNGWFNWPFNFDPLWLENCDGFTKKENKIH